MGNTGDITGECCGFYEAGDDDSIFDGTIVVYPGTCDNLQTAVTLGGVNNILGAIAGIVGLLGMAQMAATVVVAPIWGGWTYLISPFFSVGISILIFLLFYKNWKLIKTYNPKGL